MDNTKIAFALKNKEKRFKNLVQDLPSSSKYTQFELLFWIQGLINYIKWFFNKGLKGSCGVTKWKVITLSSTSVYTS